MKPIWTICSGCGVKFDRSRGYSGTGIHPYCTSKRCTAMFIKNSAAMAAAPLDLQMPCVVVNGFDDVQYLASQQRRLKA